jgi:hypothetical protein
VRHENAPPPEVDTAPATEPPPPEDTPVAAEPRRRRFTGARTVVRHRVTQLIAVLVLGLAIGAGVAALFVHEQGSEGSGGDTRQHSRHNQNGDQDREGGQRGER